MNVWFLRHRTNLLVLAGYTVLAIAYFGRGLLPHPGAKLIGFDPSGVQRDPEFFVWAFAWWPHAIGGWTNPFFTHVIYAPVGVNLAWTTSVPGLALAFSPLTILFGPAVAFNVAQLLLPALSAWTAFLLCRYLTRSVWAALIGGYLFGFSSFALAHEFGGDLNLTGVFMVPLIALALVRFVRGELGRRGLTLRMGIMLGVELWISTEVVVTLTIMLAFGVVLGIALLPEARRRVAASLVPITGAYAGAAVLAAPLLYYVWKGPRPGAFANQFSGGDLLNLFLPTRLIELGGSALASVSAHFTPPNDYERGLYLGPPALLIILLLAIRNRRSPAVRFVVAGLVLAIVLAAGTALHVDGHRVVAFPWRLVANIGPLDDLETQRFTLYVSLLAAVAVALWIGATRGRLLSRPVILPVLAVAALVPAVFSGSWAGAPERWPFFTHQLYKLCIPPGETLAVFPFGRWGDSMLWQAESGFSFKLAEGDAGRDTYPPNFVFAPVVSELQFEFQDNVRPTMPQLLSFAKSDHVDRIVSVEVNAYPDGTQMHAFGPVQLIGGVLVAPACGYNSLAGDKRRIRGQ